MVFLMFCVVLVCGGQMLERRLWDGAMPVPPHTTIKTTDLLAQQRQGDGLVEERLRAAAEPLGERARLAVERPTVLLALPPHHHHPPVALHFKIRSDEEEGVVSIRLLAPKGGHTHTARRD